MKNLNKGIKNTINIELIEASIEEKQQEIDDKQNEINSFEINVDDKEEQFCYFLDENKESIFGCTPSEIMRKCDPIMYRTELLNYVDNLEVSDEEVYQELESELDTLESEMRDLQNILYEYY